ncbi:hypothetical protein HPB51_024748 [Rhipicephalus microplus]|uniref:Tick transposon n=1 Tax=Rhipicephalus microplus TaxID=6941 RepID=A0A9J6D7L9_RHIMP|nr:hypothetical protein HPB51_024748 [Rhipicephalus microplus]
MGVHSTWERLTEAQHVNRLERLQLTNTGRALVQDLGYRIEDDKHVPHHVPYEIRNYLHISNIPRNMHPEYDKERRQARIKLLKQILQRTNSNEENVTYTDTAA